MLSGMPAGEQCETGRLRGLKHGACVASARAKLVPSSNAARPRILEMVKHYASSPRRICGPSMNGFRCIAIGKGDSDILRGVLKRLLTRLRQPLRDWLDLQNAKRENRALDARHKEGLKNANTAHDRAGVESQYLDELEIIWHPIYLRQSYKLAARARSLGVQVPPRPKVYEDDDNWYFSSSSGDWYLTGEAKERIQHAPSFGKNVRSIMNSENGLPWGCQLPHLLLHLYHC